MKHIIAISDLILVLTSCASLEDQIRDKGPEGQAFKLAFRSFEGAAKRYQQCLKPHKELPIPDVVASIKFAQDGKNGIIANSTLRPLSGVVLTSDQRKALSECENNFQIALEEDYLNRIKLGFRPGMDDSYSFYYFGRLYPTADGELHNIEKTIRVKF